MENWNDTKDKLKQKFAKIWDNDMNSIEGHKEEVIQKLQTKLNKTREELTKIIERL